MNPHYEEQLRWVSEHPEDCPVESVRTIASDLITALGMLEIWKRKVAELEERIAQPRARRGDPETSHEAAASVSHNITERRRAVFEALRALGPATDLDLWFFYATHRDSRGWPQQSESGLRTRRAELVDLGKVRESGHSVVTGRKRIVWVTAVPDLV